MGYHQSLFIMKASNPSTNNRQSHTLKQDTVIY